MTVYPRAVSRFGLAAMQSRALRTNRALRAPPPQALDRTWLQRPARRTVVRLWIPATAIFWLLSPIPLIFAPLAWLAPPQVRPANPYAAVLALGRLLTSMGGTVVDVDTPDCLVRLRIS